MWNPLNAFLGLTPLKRLILLLAGMLLISLTVTAYGIYQYVFTMGAYFKIAHAVQESPEVVHGLVTPAASRLAPFFDLCRALDGLASAVAAVPPGPASDTLVLTPAQRAEAERILGGMATLETDALLYFALQNAPFESFPNFRTYRDRVRFIASYAQMLKAGNPAADLTVAWEALHRQHRLIETALPTLLSRMVGVAGMHIEDRTLHGLLQSGLVAPEEAGRLLTIIGTTDPLRPTLLEAMAMESVYVGRIYHRLARQAPLGTWLLDAIYGDPVAQFRDLASRAETLQTDEMRDRMRDFGLATPRTHILVLIAWPNLLRARTVIREREALHAVLRTELAACAGRVASFPDPFTGGPLPSLASSGRTIWYSAGPNGRDESLGGDDIAFGKPLP